jgi:hypothetical protein
MHRLYKLRPGDELTLERVEMDGSGLPGISMLD